MCRYVAPKFDESNGQVARAAMGGLSHQTVPSHSDGKTLFMVRELWVPKEPPVMVLEVGVSRVVYQIVCKFVDAPVDGRAVDLGRETFAQTHNKYKTVRSAGPDAA